MHRIQRMQRIAGMVPPPAARAPSLLSRAAATPAPAPVRTFSSTGCTLKDDKKGRGRRMPYRRIANTRRKAEADKEEPAGKKDGGIPPPDEGTPVLSVVMTDRPVFPGFSKTINVTDEGLIKSMRTMLDTQPYVAVFMSRDPSFENDIISESSQVYSVGTLCRVSSVTQKEDDASYAAVYLQGIKRVRLEDVLDAPGQEGISEIVDNGVSHVVRVKDAPVHSTADLMTSPSQVVAALGSSLLTAVQDYVQLNPDARHSVYQHLLDASGRDTRDGDVSASDILLEHPWRFAYFVGAISASTGQSTVLQDLLESSAPEDLLRHALRVMKHDIALSFSVRHARLHRQETLNDPARTSLQDLLRELNKGESRSNDARKSGSTPTFGGIPVGNQLPPFSGSAPHHPFGGNNQGQHPFAGGAGPQSQNPPPHAPSWKERMRERASHLVMPPQVQEAFEAEMRRLEQNDMGMDATTSRAYVEWLLRIPWGWYMKDDPDLIRARRILDAGHYGMDKVKKRVLEYIAALQLRGGVPRGRILLFVGPPGVGKTSIAMSLSKCLGREFARVQLGGVDDAADLRGHRRTYVASMPGKIVQAFRNLKTMNPVLVMDEIDKMSRNIRGNPYYPLLELFDPSQNREFSDNYLDVPFDVSRVLFVCTANSLSTIPPPLLDRMEIIQVDPYVLDDKIKIARDYLIPRARDAAGLKNVDIDVSRDALIKTIEEYAPEAGVRQLKQKLDLLFHASAARIVNFVLEQAQGLDVSKYKTWFKNLGKIPTEPSASTDEHTSTSPTDKPEIDAQQAPAPAPAPSPQEAAAASEQAPITPINPDDPNATQVDPTRIVTEDKAQLTPLRVPEGFAAEIHSDDVSEILGAPMPHQYTKFADTLNPVGVGMGLSTNGLGTGNVLHIESLVLGNKDKDDKGSGSVTISGLASDVVKDSVRLATSWIEANHSALGIDPADVARLTKSRLHVHFPAGAVKKDGPSAGLAIVLTLLSIVLNRGIRSDLAVTGEISLVGHVTAIGGLSAKVAGAHQQGISVVLAPKDNAPEARDIPESIRKHVDLHFVDSVWDAIPIAFPDLPIADYARNHNHARMIVASSAA